MEKEEILYLEIAGFIIKIVFVLSPDTVEFERNYIKVIKDYYHDFLINENIVKSDYTIEVVYEHSFRVVINKKTNFYIHLYQQISSNKLRTFYHLSGGQFQIILRKITHELLVKNKGFILHASASKVGGKAAVFLGESGAGKSTTMRLLSAECPPLGDDSVILKKESGKYYFYSSSAKEKNAWFVKNFGRIELGGIYFIVKSKVTKMTKINDKQLIVNLLSKQLFSEKEDVSKQMDNLICFINKFNKFYYLEISLKESNNLVEILSNV